MIVYEQPCLKFMTSSYLSCRQFAATKEQAADPLKASAVYDDIRTAIWDAEEAAAVAAEVSKGTVEEVVTVHSEITA